MKRLLDSMNESHPKLVEELVPKLMTLGEVQRVLQQLLREQVSIRDLGAILEVLVEAAQQSKNVVHLVESVRQSLGRGLVHPLLDARAGCGCWCWSRGLRAELLNTFDPQSAALLLGDGARPAGMPADFYEAAGGICETPNRRSLYCGTARASMSESSPLSRAAMAGAVSAEGDGAGAGGDSSGDSGPKRRDGWLEQMLAEESMGDGRADERSDIRMGRRQGSRFAEGQALFDEGRELAGMVLPGWAAVHAVYRRHAQRRRLRLEGGVADGSRPAAAGASADGALYCAADS